MLPRQQRLQSLYPLHGSTRYMAETKLKIHRSSGFCAAPNRKIGSSLANLIVEKVQKFYELDENSRVMPGKKDCISVMINGKKERVQKRLLLCKLRELHGKFLLKYPDIKISLAKFTKLRAASCVVVGYSGDQNECVCNSHQNMKLKIHGLNLALQGTGQTYFISDLTKQMTCLDPNNLCNLLIKSRKLECS